METSCGLCVSESQWNKIFCPHTFLTSYRSFIAPYLTYGLVAWGQASKSSLDEQLLKLQKRALCFIYFSNHNEHAIPLFADANILPLIFSYYRYESIAKLMCDMEFHQTVPKLNLNTVSGMHQYNTQSSESQNFYINIPDCPLTLILFQESELNCGMKYGTVFLYTVRLNF